MRFHKAFGATGSPEICWYARVGPSASGVLPARVARDPEVDSLFMNFPVRRKAGRGFFFLTIGDLYAYSAGRGLNRGASC